MSKIIKGILGVLVFITGLCAKDVISAEKIIEKVNNGREVHYENCIIEGEVDLTHLDNMKLVEKDEVKNFLSSLGLISDESAIYLSNVNNNLHFKYCTFKNGIYGYKNIGTNTYNTKFNGSVDFINCKLKDASEFKYSEFNNEINCSNTRFNQEAQFKYAEFKGPVNFTEAVFLGEANFKYSEFYVEADFSESKFRKEGNFKYSKFKEMVNFSSTAFSVKANFKYAEISGSINFTGAEISGYSNFKYTKFKDIDFRGTSFQQANFKYAKFNGKADLHNVVIKGFANFKYTDFNGELNVDNIEIKSDIDMEQASVGGESLSACLLNNR